MTFLGVLGILVGIIFFIWVCILINESKKKDRKPKRYSKIKSNSGKRMPSQFT